MKHLLLQFFERMIQTNCLNFSKGHGSMHIPCPLQHTVLHVHFGTQPTKRTTQNII